jgi:hypothetical protein
MANVRASTVFADDRFTLIAIESLEFQTDRTDHRRLVTGSLKPVAVIIREADKTCAFDMNAQPVDIDRLELPAGIELE